MKFLEYLGTDQATLDHYLNERLVTVQHHETFPLDIYTYGRTCQYTGLWDNITSRCRGIIINRETGDIVARPFEKFHNLQTQNRPETDMNYLETLGEPTIWEKVDGFMATSYWWEGKWYVASKGSFHSPHAKWATDWLQKRNWEFPKGWTPVFEGLNPNLRIVIDYGKREELVLLALIDTETGKEIQPDLLKLHWLNPELHIPVKLNRSLRQAVVDTRRVDVHGEEGYVCTWYNVEGPPHRVKLKYIDYLRLHRIVTGVSPKNIWEALSQGMALDEWENDSTQWFAKFVAKWKRALTTEYVRIETQSRNIIKMVNDKLKFDGSLTGVDYFHARKAFALEFMRPENKEFAPVLFAMLDNKDVRPVIWKKVKRLIVGSKPMIDAHSV